LAGIAGTFPEAATEEGGTMVTLVPSSFATIWVNGFPLVVSHASSVTKFVPHDGVGRRSVALVA